MYESVFKFSKYSTVEQQSKMSLSEVEVPDIYICNKDQFNLNLSRAFGYTHQSHFLAGIAGIETKLEKATWAGMDGNHDFSELRNNLYGIDETMYHTFYVKYTKVKLT